MVNWQNAMSITHNFTKPSLTSSFVAVRVLGVLLDRKYVTKKTEEDER